MARRGFRRAVWQATLGLLCIAVVVIFFWPARRSGPYAAPQRKVAEKRLPLPSRGRIATRSKVESPATPLEIVPREEPVSLPGQTRFQRRLSAGDEFLKLRQLLDEPSADLKATTARFKALLPALLHADRPRLFEEHPGYLRAHLGLLSRLDLKHVMLSNPSSPEDRLGMETRIRVWTLTGGYPRGEIAIAEENLGQLEALVGSGPGGGYDVLVTPKKGQEVLPFQWPLQWAAGVYYRDDRYCTVRSGVRPWYRKEVLKHELIHALTFERLKGPHESRAVTEGLAEYLRFLKPGDSGLQVPPGRFSNELRLLEEKLEALSASGAETDQLQPSRLASLSAEEFYALRQFSYLLSLAGMAFIGRTPIEEAFQERSEGPILEAVKRIRWPDLLSFIRRYAADGSPARAITVNDVPPGQDAPFRPAGEGQDRLRDAFSALGVNLPPDFTVDPALLSSTGEDALTDPSQAASVLDLLLEHPAALVFLADGSQALQRPFKLGTNGGRLPEGPPGEDLPPLQAGDFTRLLYREVVERSKAAAIPLVRLAQLPQACDPASLELDAAYTAGTLVPWLASRGRGEQYLVLCVGALDTPSRLEIQGRSQVPLTETGMREELVRYYRDKFLAGPALGAALVVDLSDGEGDALSLARGLAATLDFEGAVAYWNPQR